MKKLFYVLLLSVLVAMMVLSGCTQPASQPAPESSPSESSPSETPEQHEQVAIDILSMAFGGAGYVASFALGDMINKYSPWLRATTLETPGGIYNLKILADDPEVRKKSIIFGTFATNNLLEKGIDPFDQEYSGIKAVSLAQSVAHTYVTLDPNIKSGRDFAGKRIGLPSASSNGKVEPEVLMEYAWDVKDKAKLEYLGWSEAIQALRDGMVDVAISNPSFIGEGKVAASPAMEELMSIRSDYYFVPISKEDIDTARNKSGYPLFPAELPPGVLGPTQTEPHGIALITNGWMADEELPDDVVYEICRVIYEYYEEFWPRHATLQGLTPETMATLAPNESDYHPGAIKFYKDKGLEIGFELD